MILRQKEVRKIVQSLEEQPNKYRRLEGYGVSDVLYNLTLTVDGVGVKDVVKFYDASATEHYTNVTALMGSQMH